MLLILPLLNLAMASSSKINTKTPGGLGQVNKMVEVWRVVCLLADMPLSFGSQCRLVSFALWHLYICLHTIPLMLKRATPQLWNLQALAQMLLSGIQKHTFRRNGIPTRVKKPIFLSVDRVRSFDIIA